MNATSDHEESLPRNSGKKTKRIELGLAILSAKAVPGVTYEPEEIACFCDCTPVLIANIEARALRKMRQKMAEQFNIENAETEDLRRWLALQLLS
jgi:hypothetical protein